MAAADGKHRMLGSDASIDELLSGDDAFAVARNWFESGVTTAPPSDDDFVAPIGTQEVWAAGVTYARSRTARAAESHGAGGEVFYDRVYEADRPELFLKATPRRVVGHGAGVHIRGDSEWDVPEPELTLVIDHRGRMVGQTIGNDMSSRSIEGANPLYLPQAKVYRASAALGPRLVLSEHPPTPDTALTMSITRTGEVVFEGETTLARMARTFSELVEYLFRDNDFPAGVFLMTGTGIVPGDDFTLEDGDVISIAIEGVGVLVNHVER